MPKQDQGVSPNRYQVIPRTLIFIIRGEEVLLIKGAPTKRLWANLYNGIGGHIEHNEDVFTAAKRELKEEAGIEALEMRLCGTVLIDTGGDVGIALYVFRGKYAGSELIHSNEGILEWVSITELSNYPLVEDLKILLPRVLEQKPGMSPFSAHYRYDENDLLKIHFGC